MIASSGTMDWLIVISCFAIPLQLGNFIYRQPKLIPFKYRAVLAFVGIFVFVCGVAQLLNVLAASHLILSAPVNSARILTALLCVTIAIILVHVLPDIGERCRESADLESSMQQKIVELDAAYHAAEQARMNKREFMAFLAHELRNPLHVITANVDFMSETSVNDEQRDYIRSIDDNAKLMASIVNDVLDISRLQAGRMTFELIPVDLHDLTTSLLKNVRHQAKNKDVTLTLDYAQDAPWYVISDPTRLHQIMLNLISNSIKFTQPQGSITVSVRAFRQNPYTHSTVATTPSRTSKNASLSGQRVISSLSNGDADLDIDEELPSTTASAPTSTSTSTSSNGRSGMNKDNIHNHAQFSDGNLDGAARNDKTDDELTVTPEHADEREQMYVQFEVCDTGVGISSALMPQLFSPYTQAKLSTVREFGGTGLGLAIIHQIIKSMRGHIHVHSRIGVGSTFTITLRLNLTSEMETRSLKAVKSPSPPLIVKRKFESTKSVSDALKPTRPVSLSPQLTSPSNSSNSNGLPILIVDDNEVNRKILSRILVSLGYRVDVCCDGLEAVNCVKSRDPADLFLCVLMDICMPNMDGYEATRHIRANGAGGDKVYIIALTANAIVDERRKAKEAGMNDFVTKPIRKTELHKLLSKVQRLLRPDHAQQSPPDQGSADPSSSNVTTNTSPPSSSLSSSETVESVMSQPLTINTADSEQETRHDRIQHTTKPTTVKMEEETEEEEPPPHAAATASNIAILPTTIKS